MEISKMTHPISYQGGKGRLAGRIVDIMDVSPAVSFYDMCCGSGAVSIELVKRGHDPNFVTMVDAGPWGLFWERVGSGSFSLTRFKEYIDSIPSDRALIKGFMEELSQQPSSLDTEYVFLLLQAGAFGGKAIWESEGEWRNTTFRSFWKPTPTSSRRSPVNPMMPMPDTLYERVAVVCEYMHGVIGIRANVQDVDTPEVDAVVYVDPPYEGTTTYGHVLDVEDYVASLSQETYVSEGRPLSDGAVCLSGGRKKGGISGERKRKANQEWLSMFRANVLRGYSGVA